TEHHEYYLEPADVVALIPRVAEIYSEPFGNESVVPAYHCARMANELGIRVLLGGDGGDELFAGNERYATQKIFDLYRRVPSPLRRGLLEPVVTHFPAGGSIWPVRKARGYIAKARMRMPDRTQIYNYMERFGADTVFQPDFLAEVDVDEPRRLLRESYDGVRADSMLNRCLAMDLRFTLADNDLPKVSRMAELEGVRVCYPLLDDELIDFAARLPPELKLRRLELRWFFKHALRDFLPEEIIRKTKHGMGMPFGLWLETYAPLQELVRDSLDALKRRDIVRPAFVDQVSEMHRNEHAVYYGVMIWLLVQLEQWLRCHDDGSGV
ncbi:MAG TPA: asparagine synthase C-terminal domain-containing protein, partial [Candidatus Polarisedimenticolaceae bacterium]|nr:asparagine synthase C-terminal domain-containing protein [Candidatus Polarisedimenticolaceae bacterium]